MFFVYFAFLILGAFLLLFGVGFLLAFLSAMIRPVTVGWGAVFWYILLAVVPGLIGFYMTIHYASLIFT